MAENGAEPLSRRRMLQLILITAVVQGWSLYGLSWSVDHHTSLAKNSGLLIALYAFFTVAPLTLQFLAEHGARRLAWYFALGVGVLFAGLGWHYGHNIANQPDTGFFSHNESFQHITAGVALWLLLMPLLQSRLMAGHWQPVYANFFAQKWRNLLTVIEATLFTALFWGLLYLCDALFRMLGVTFFGELYRDEIFSIPVTWLTFGVALYLIGGLDQLTAVTLRQILSILKWLAVPALFIVGFFTIALALSIPGLVGTGRRTIDASTLLWIVAIIVLLLNSAYRDGETEQPYPRAIGVALRVLVPLTLVIALVATWSLLIRTRLYGLTVARSWGWIVALAAIAFTAGYSYCAIHKDRWMRGMNRVNVVVVIELIAVVTLALTPVLSPYRLAANSQSRVLLSGQNGRTAYAAWRNDIIDELRFDSGEYGKARLREIEADSSAPKDLSEKATEALAANYSRYGVSPVDAHQALAATPIYPKGRTLPPELASVVEAQARQQIYAQPGIEAAYGIFIDLTGDGVEDFALMRTNYGELFEHVDGGWKKTADLSDYSGCSPARARADMEAGRFGVRPPKLAELTIGSMIFMVRPTRPCAGN